MFSVRYNQCWDWRLVRNIHHRDMTSTSLELPESEIHPGAEVEVRSGKEGERCKHVA